MTPNLTQIPCNATDLVRYKQYRIETKFIANNFFLIDFIRSIPIFLV